MRLDSMIAAANTTTPVWMRTSRCRTCASSWPRTPSSSAGGHAERQPALTAIAELRGPRPVASARGKPSGMR